MGDFSLAFQNISTKSIKATENVIKKTVFDFTSSIISDTPVDTSRAKNNWFVTFDTPSDNTIDTLDNSGNTAINKANSKIMNNKVPMVYWINNNLPYIMRLEYGWSKQSPAGMVRLNIQRFNQFLKGNIK